MAKGDHRKLIKTRHPGIYRRGSSSYVVTYYVNGKQKRETVAKLDQALALKAARKTDQLRGEF